MPLISLKIKQYVDSYLLDKINNLFYIDSIFFSIVEETIVPLVILYRPAFSV